MKNESVALERVVETLEDLKINQGYQLLLDIIAFEGAPKRRVIYLLLNMERHQRIAVETSVGSNEVIPSVSELFSNATWLERELYDLFGIKNSLEGGNERILSHHQMKGHLLTSAFKWAPTNLNKACAKAAEDLFVVDGSHPAICEPVSLGFKLEGERVISCQPQIGFSHRGIEKISESRNFNQIIPLVERLNHHSAALNSVGWAMTVEGHLGIEITDRSKVLRMIFMELARISDHLQQIRRVLGLIDIKQKGKALDGMLLAISGLFESYCGSGFLGNIARVGGLTRDIPMGWISACYEVIKDLSSRFELFQRDVLKSRVWCERTRICVLKASDAISYGCTGPALRACGINYDLRKVSPYYFYRDLDFEVPLGLNGDAYDRSLVRIEEIRQSLRIVDQLLDNVPVGKVAGLFESSDADLDKIVKMATGETYCSIEAANGELGYYLVTDGSAHPERLKIRPPSLALMQVYPETVKNESLSDSLVGYVSLNIISGEMDR